MKNCAPLLLFIRKYFVTLAQEITLKTSRNVKMFLQGRKNISKHETQPLKTFRCV